MTLESAALLLRLSAWSWLASVIYYLVLEGGWGASLGKRLMGLRVTSADPIGEQCPVVAARWPAYRGIPCAHRYLLHGRREGTDGQWRRVHGAVAAVDHSAVLDRPPWQRMDRRPRAAEPYACRAAERQARRIRRSEGVTCRSRSSPFRLCDASDRTPCTRWSARPAADDCSSASIRSFAVMSGFTKFHQGHRRSTRPGVMWRGPGGCTGSRGADR